MSWQGLASLCKVRHTGSFMINLVLAFAIVFLSTTSTWCLGYQILFDVFEIMHILSNSKILSGFCCQRRIPRRTYHSGEVSQRHVTFLQQCSWRVLRESLQQPHLPKSKRPMSSVLLEYVHRVLSLWPTSR